MEESGPRSSRNPDEWRTMDLRSSVQPEGERLFVGARVAPGGVLANSAVRSTCRLFGRWRARRLSRQIVGSDKNL
jgi:hypothetical protein